MILDLYPRKVSSVGCVALRLHIRCYPRKACELLVRLRRRRLRLPANNCATLSCSRIIRSASSERPEQSERS